MQVNTTNYLSFGKRGNRNSQYTFEQKQVMRDIRKAALEHGWHDIYTEKPFSAQNPPSIEHLVPFSFKHKPEVKQLMGRGFQINGLDNIFPAGLAGNGARDKKSIVRTILEAPEILDRLLKELEKYKLYKSPFVNGEIWAGKLHATLLNNIEGLCSSVRSRKMRVYGLFTKAKHL